MFCASISAEHKKSWVTCVSAAKLFPCRCCRCLSSEPFSMWNLLFHRLSPSRAASCLAPGISLVKPSQICCAALFDVIEQLLFSSVWLLPSAPRDKAAPFVWCGSSLISCNPRGNPRFISGWAWKSRNSNSKTEKIKSSLRSLTGRLISRPAHEFSRSRGQRLQDVFAVFYIHAFICDVGCGHQTGSWGGFVCRHRTRAKAFMFTSSGIVSVHLLWSQRTKCLQFSWDFPLWDLSERIPPFSSMSTWHLMVLRVWKVWTFPQVPGRETNWGFRHLWGVLLWVSSVSDTYFKDPEVKEVWRSWVWFSQLGEAVRQTTGWEFPLTAAETFQLSCAQERLGPQAKWTLGGGGGCTPTPLEYDTKPPDTNLQFVLLSLKL